MTARITIALPGQLPQITDTPSALVICAPDPNQPLFTTQFLHAVGHEAAAVMLASALWIIRSEFGEVAVRNALAIEKTMVPATIPGAPR